MAKPLVTIFTANSNSGRYCIEELFGGKLASSSGVRVRGVFRSAEKAEPFRLKYPELEIVTGVDASKPETLAKAYEGAQAALIVTPHDPAAGFSNDAQLTETMIQHAVNNGVEYIVLVASFTVRNMSKMPIIGSRFYSSEQLLIKLGEEKGIKWTVLRGGVFMDNLLHQFKKIKQEGVYAAPANMSVPMVDTKDIGRSAAACLANPHEYQRHHGKHYEMSGPEKLSGQQVADTFSKVLGQKIEFKELSAEVVARVMPEALSQIYLTLSEDNDAAPLSADVKNLIGEEGNRLESFIRNHLDHF